MKSLLAPILGFAFAIAVAVLLAFIEIRFELALYSFSFWFIIPVGAIGSGMLAGLGYYIAARMTGTAAGKGVLVSMAAASVLCYLLINYLPYKYVVLPEYEEAVAEFREAVEAGEYIDELTGRPLTLDDVQEELEVPSFLTFMDLSIRAKQMNIGRGGGGNPVQMSPFFAYAHEVLIAGGFLAGAFFIYAILSSAPYCEGCGQYLKKSGSFDRYPEDDERMEEILTDASRAIESRDPDIVSATVRDHDAMVRKSPKGGKLKVSIVDFACGGCDNRLTRFRVSKLGDNGFVEIGELSTDVWRTPPAGHAVVEPSAENPDVEIEPPLG